MASFYQALLGIEAASAALAVAVILGVQQLIVGSISRQAALLVVRSRLVAVGAMLLGLTAAWSLVGAVLLSTTHDLVSGYVGSDHVLASPIAGLGCGIAILLATALLVLGASRALSLLDPGTAAQRLLNHHGTTAWLQVVLERANLGDFAQSSRKTHRSKPGRPRHEAAPYPDALDMCIEIAERSIADGDRTAFASVVALTVGAALSALSEGDMRLDAAAPARAAAAADLVDAKLNRLASRAQDFGRLDFLPLIASGLHGAATTNLVVEVLPPSQRLLDRTARAALAARDGPVLSRTIEANTDQAMLGLRLGGRAAERVFDDACRLLISVVSQIPAAFRDPNVPDLAFPLDPMGPSTDPVNAVLEAFDALGDAAFPGGEAKVDALIYADAVEVFCKALVDRSVKVFKDGRLEEALVSAMMKLGRLGEEAGQRGDARTVYVCLAKLATLADDAPQPFFREYPGDIAGYLTGIGMLAEEKDLKIAGLGMTLAEFAVEALVDDLPDQLDEAMREALVAGRYSYVSDGTRGSFLARAERKAGRKVGYRATRGTV